MDIAKLLQSQLDLGSISKSLSGELGADKDQVGKAAAMIVPELLSGMSKNAQSEQGLNSLFIALDDHKDTDVSDTDAFLKNIDLGDSQKILGHILGSNSSKVEKKVSKESGLDSKQVSQLMLMLAPLVMSFLGSQKKKKSGFNTETLMTLLGGLSGTSGGAGALTSVLGSLLGSQSKSTSKSKSKSSSQKASSKQGFDIADAANLLGKFLKKK